MATIEQQRGGRVEGAWEGGGKVYRECKPARSNRNHRDREAEGGRELQEMYIICASYSHIRGLEPPGAAALHHIEVFSSASTRKWSNPNLKAKKGTLLIPPRAHSAPS